MKRKLYILLLLVLSFSLMQAQDDDLPDPMSPPRLVNDFANLFNSSQLNELEKIARNYNDTTSTQIYVVTISDLKGYDVSDFAIRLGEKWKIGQKDKNNGVLILIKPRIGNERGHVFIATGYGVEHILTDARTGRIIDQYMMPYLQNGDYYNATKAAMITIIKYLAGEFHADNSSSTGDSISAIITLILFILLIIFLSKKNTGGPSNGRQSRGGGYYGGFGGGFGGRPSGGGFGGGGGGSFGGGGAGRGF